MGYAWIRTTLENMTLKNFWDFVIQPDHLILTRRPDKVIVNKKKNRELNRELCFPGGQHDENKKWREWQVLRPCQRINKALKHKGDGDTNCNCRTRNNPQWFWKSACPVFCSCRTHWLLLCRGVRLPQRH